MVADIDPAAMTKPISIDWPHNGQLPEVLCSYREALQDSDSRSVSFVFPKKAWIEPSTICGLALEILNNSKREIQFTGDVDSLNYLSRLDFFSLLGIDYQESFTRHPDAGRIIPLQSISDSPSVQTAVCKICDMAARHIPNAREFVPSMEWTVNELVDNVITHSETPTPGLVIAQYYPEQKRMRIGISDYGLGIRATLAEAYKFDKDFEAIEKAIERGITRNSKIGQGNGLAGSAQISKLNGGELLIYSGYGYYKQSEKIVERRRSDTFVKGTQIALSLRTDRPVDLMQTFMAEAAAGWTYFDAEAQRLVDGDGISILKEVAHTRGREPARALRQKILCLTDSIQSEKALKLDFSGVRSPSSSFLDELLGKLVVELTPPVFKKKIEVANMSPTILALARAVASQRLKTEGGGPNEVDA